MNFILDYFKPSADQEKVAYISNTTFIQLQSMPLCEGRPNLTCPRRATGKLSQGDLILCRECEEFRFPYLVTGSTVNKDSNSKSSMSKVRTRSTRPLSSTAVAAAVADEGKDGSYCCTKCAGDIITGTGLTCDVCTGVFHSVCVNLSDGVATTLRSIIIDTTGWVCPPCRLDVRVKSQGLLSGQAKLAEEVACLKDEVKQLKSELQGKNDFRTAATKTIKDKDTRELLAEVHLDMSDKLRRANNVVVTGLSPVDGVDDVDLLSQLCENYLPIKPAVRRERCRQLGKPQDGKTQPLVIQLESEDCMKELISCSRRCATELQNPNNSLNIYINRDLTPAGAHAAFLLREKRRSQRRISRLNGINNDNQEQSSADDSTLTSPSVNCRLDVHALVFNPPPRSLCYK